YAPSSTRDAAAEIAVRSGEEISGVDIRYRGEAGHVISGIITADADSGSDSAPDVRLFRAGTESIEAEETGSEAAPHTFAIYGIADGEYDVVAASGEEDAEMATAARHISVKGADVGGLRLVLAPTGHMSGRLVLEAEPAGSAGCMDKRAAVPQEIV